MHREEVTFPVPVMSSEDARGHWNVYHHLKSERSIDDGFFLSYICSLLLFKTNGQTFENYGHRI